MLAVAGGTAGAAKAHDVQLTGTEVDLGILDYNGFAWNVEVRARINCTGAELTHMGVTLEQLTSYTGNPGGAALIAEPPPNTVHRMTAMLPPGLYQLRFGAAVCRSTQDMPDGHEGDHGDAIANPPTALVNLPDCRPRASLRAPLVPVVGDESEMRAQCPARLCDVWSARVSTRTPLVPVQAGPPVPAPCPTISVRSANVPIDVVCGPGAIAARANPLVPVTGGPCRGAVELVSASAGVANASASRVIGRKRFKIRRGSFKSVRVPLEPRAWRALKLTRVLRARAVVKSAGKRRKSKPFTVIKRR
jgi:hypothetical protein